MKVLQGLEWRESFALDDQIPFALCFVEGLRRAASVSPLRSPFESLRVTGSVSPTLKPEGPE